MEYESALNFKSTNRFMIKLISTTLAVAIFFVTKVFGDIAPNPIQAKGIQPDGKTTVRMVSEKVFVDLYRDSSVVECLFYMKNEGREQKINIGFPEMNFHHFNPKKGAGFSNSFRVEENGINVSLIENPCRGRIYCQTSRH